jgi:hypothetical protein
MTDLVPPPDDPNQQLQWARETLAKWSQPHYRALLGAKEIRASARAILQEHGQFQPSPEQWWPGKCRGPGRPRRQPKP